MKGLLGVLILSVCFLFLVPDTMVETEAATPLPIKTATPKPTTRSTPVPKPVSKVKSTTNQKQINIKSIQTKPGPNVNSNKEIKVEKKKTIKKQVHKKPIRRIKKAKVKKTKVKSKKKQP